MCDIFDFPDILKYKERMTNTPGDKYGDSVLIENKNGSFDCWVVFYDRWTKEPYRVLEKNIKKSESKK